MERKDLRDILLIQDEIKAEGSVERDLSLKLDEYKNTPFTIIVSGVRRCGKSTLLLKNKNAESYYVNFDDERFINFSVDDFQMMYELLIELFGKRDSFIFDEIQNIPGWERFVRRLHDEGKKVYITGSNARMLSMELGTHLTGRNIALKLYPFSFREFLRFKNSYPEETGNIKPEERALLRRAFSEYMEKGGFPEFLKYEKNEYLKNLYENIIYRDIITRHKLSSERPLKEIAYFLSGNIGKEISFNMLRKYADLSSTTTVREYMGYLEDSYLIGMISRYSDSVKKQLYFNKKIYMIDTGLLNIIGFRSSPDHGRRLENIVYLELIRREKNVFFHKEKYECDFLIKEKDRITQAIQVTKEISGRNREREISGLTEAMKTHRLKKGLILTENDEDTINSEGYIIEIKPLWKWLLE